MDIRPKAIPLISIQSHNCFRLNEDALSELLHNSRVSDLPVAVVSVAGAYRKGKSFLLDFFLRYAYRKYSDDAVEREIEDWLGKENEPLVGFSWKGGSEPDTTGILMWPEIFVCKYKSGSICILFLDTQGTFDSYSSVKEWATVFAVSTMISSVQIYNLSQNIQEDDLQNLEVFAEYGRLALNDSTMKPFQKLLFLIRDWSYPYEAEFGLKGGKQILDKRMEIKSTQHKELQKVRENINLSFQQIDCYLMPHPGMKVTTDPKFDGRLTAIEPEFKAHLRTLVPIVLSPENLVIKRINGQPVKAKELVTYLKSYMKIFNGDELPTPTTLLLATSEANNLTAAAESLDTYRKKMETISQGQYLNPSVLEAQHSLFKDEVIIMFDRKPKMGGGPFSIKYRQQLGADIDKSFEQYKAMNRSKNFFSIFVFPARIFCVICVCQILSIAFATVGLEKLSNFTSFIVKIAFLILLAWIYVQYQSM